MRPPTNHDTLPPWLYVSPARPDAQVWIAAALAHGDDEAKPMTLSPVEVWVVDGRFTNEISSPGLYTLKIYRTGRCGGVNLVQKSFKNIGIDSVLQQ